MTHHLRRACIAALAFTGLGLSLGSQAHVSFNSAALPIAYAGKSWIGALNVPHGCSDANGAYDTRSVEIEIPATFTGVRPSHSTFGRASVTRDGTTVTKITWTRANATDEDESDSHFYQFTVRGTLPATAFTKLQFPTRQNCKNELSVVWEGAEVPTVLVLPTRTPGWNKYTIPTGVSLTGADVKSFFADAQIVWAGQKAYSANAETTAQIGRTAGASSLVTATLTDVVLNAGDEIWVRY